MSPPIQVLIRTYPCCAMDVRVGFFVESLISISNKAEQFYFANTKQLDNSIVLRVMV